MPTKIHIFGEPGVGLPDMRNRVRGLENDLSRFLGRSGEVVFDRDDEHYGVDWSVEIVIYRDRNVNLWVNALAGFLRTWGVPDGRLVFSIFEEAEGNGVQHRRIVFP